MSKNSDIPKKSMSKSLEENIQLIKNVFERDDTLIVRTFQNKHLEAAKFCIFYINGMVDDEIINENVIQPILLNNLTQQIYFNDLFEEVQNKILIINEIKVLDDFNQMIHTIIDGDTLLLIEGYSKAFALNSKGWQSRQIVEPTTETIIRGPREGFNESLITNLSLLRRKLKTPDLKFEMSEMGERSHTKICICYLESLADPKIIKALYERLETIKIDGILDSGYIQEMIKDSPYLPYKTIGNTERPDIVAGKLLEGRIALFVDGSPAVLTLPFLFIEYFQSSEDYYNNYVYSSINRIIRVIGMILTVSVPAIYVALLTYHQEMIPTTLLLSIAATREGVPFPTIIEAICMMFVFEILREAGLRMPIQMGQMISIVGALVLGQAAVEARIVSSPMVIIVALTGISGLLIPKLKGPNITTRFIFLLLASFLGLYGYAFGVMGLLLMLFNIKSFDIPYMQTIGTLNKQEFKDTVIRGPWKNMIYRSQVATDDIRMSTIKGNQQDEN